MSFKFLCSLALLYLLCFAVVDTEAKLRTRCGRAVRSDHINPSFHHDRVFVQGSICQYKTQCCDDMRCDKQRNPVDGWGYCQGEEDDDGEDGEYGEDGFMLTT